jgi:hypothetical protein
MAALSIFLARFRPSVNRRAWADGIFLQNFKKYDHFAFVGSFIENFSCHLT